jgi:hypothetical protein
MASSQQPSSFSMNALRAPQPSKSFTRAQVYEALEAAGNNEQATDSDIRRLTDILMQMSVHDLTSIDDECVDDAKSLELLDYLLAGK